MKFGDYLHESAIPEWKNKYINYGKGKAKIKIYKHELSTNTHLILNGFQVSQHENDGNDSTYSILQRQFISEFIDHWLNSYEVNKCNDFYLWLLEQCEKKFNILTNQMDIYYEHVRREAYFPNEGTNLISPQGPFQKSKTFKNSYDSLYSLLQSKQTKDPEVSELTTQVSSNSSQYGPSLKLDKSLYQTSKEFLRKNNLLPSYPRLLANYKNTDKDDSIRISIKKARRLLDDIMLEFYLYIQLVRTFRDLNVTGFRKIIKKFDKVCETNELNKFLKNAKTKYSIFEHGNANIQVNSSNQLMGMLVDINTEQLHGNNKSLDPLLVWENCINKWYITDLSHSLSERKQRTDRIKKLSLEYSVNEKTIHRSNRAILQMFIGGIGIGICIPMTYYVMLKLTSSPTNSYLYKFLLPLWGSWLLFFTLIIFFLFDCYIWHRNGINYRFIMFGEIHQRNGAHLFNNDFATSLISLHVYFTSWFATPCCIIAAISVYYNDLAPYAYIVPVLFFLLLILPFNIIPYWDKLVETRKWLVVGIIRLLLSGLYPVQFGDFFLGVLFCSLTYSLAEIAIITCITFKSIDCPCNIDSIRYVTILSCLPNFWRCCQCIRRLADSGDYFPHLPNAFKYAFGVAFNASFCIYRVSNHNHYTMKWFIFFATINAICTSIWDLVMDWSLIQSNSNNVLLRDDLYLAGPRDWKTGKYSSRGRAVYYISMVVDVAIRFQWIVFVVAPIHVQDNPMTSFILAFTELIRRIIWVIFRVENEHVANVQLFRITGETALPYNSTSYDNISIRKHTDMESLPLTESTPENSTGVTWDISSEGNLNVPKTRERRKSILDTFSRTVSRAHTSDFQRPRVYSTILEGTKDGDPIDM